jgi:transcription elongation factor GreA-like protein/transcription elongation GreA/GreB family factor
MNYLKQFLQHIHLGDYSSFLSLWEEYCLSDEVDGQEVIAILENVKKSSLALPFGKHVETILNLWETLKIPAEYDKVFELVIDLETTNSLELGDLTFAYLKKKYGNESYFNEMVRLTDLRERNNFQGAVRKFALLAHMKKGNYVFHLGGWGVGEIVDVSFVREQLSLEFDYVSGVKDLSFQNAFATLSPIPKDHFLARRFGNPDEFEAFARKNPVETIRMLLRDLGPKTASEIKNEVCDLVIPEADWSRWWQSARTKIRKDSFIDAPDDLKKPFSLRTSELTPETELQKKLDSADSVKAVINTLYAFFRDFPQASKSPELGIYLKDYLSKWLSEPISDGEALQLHFFLEDLSLDTKYTPAQELIRRFTSIEEVIFQIDIVGMKKRLLTETRALRTDWIAVFLPLVIKLDQAALRDYVLAELLKADCLEELKEVLKELIDYPQHYPQTFLWYFQKMMGHPELPFADLKGSNQFFEAFLILLHILEKTNEERDLIKKMHLFITDGRFANIRKIFQAAKKEEVQEFLLLSTKCHSISQEDIKILHSLAQVAHPDLKTITRKYDDEPVFEQTNLWITEQGLKELKERIHDIATVKTVQNANEIEEARALGDLRENAEFKAALEKRDRLQSEIKTLSDQFSRARVIEKEDVNPSCVGIGTIVSCTNPEETIEYTILGPWEANADKGILSFQSKLALAMLGKKVGDKISISGDEYVIEKIGSIFKE